MSEKQANAEAETVEEWYKVNVAIPFLDHIITELDSQFSALAQMFSRLSGLVPFVLCSREDLDISEAVELHVYHAVLPSPELVDQKLTRWRDMHLHKPADKRPTTGASTLKEHDGYLFPKITILLQILCTLTVTSCECERNARALQQLHNFMCAGMTKSRLISPALMHIHYNHSIDMDTVV